MSAIALKWVSTLRIKNRTAKHLLLFYASHNFGRPGFEFKNDTLATQLEVDVKTIRNAHKFLKETGHIQRIRQYDKSGSEVQSLTYLNIPQDFVDEFFGENNKNHPVDKSRGGGKSFPPREEIVSHHINNNINNYTHKELTGSHVDRSKNVLDIFEVDEECKNYAMKENLDIKKQIDLFNNKKHGYYPTTKSFLMFMEENVEYRKNKKNKTYTKPMLNEIKSTVPFWKAGNPDYDRVHETESKRNVIFGISSEATSGTNRNGIMQSHKDDILHRYAVG